MSSHSHHRPAGSPPTQALCLAAGLMAALLVLIGGCGQEPDDLRPANQTAHPVLEDHSRNAGLENELTLLESRNAPGDVLPIFMIGDDYRMLELPNSDASPAATTETSGKHIPLAFYIPASPDSVTGRAEKMQKLAVGVLYRDQSGPQPVYRLADFARAKLGGQVCLKAFKGFTAEKNLALPDDLKLNEGYPAIFSAAYIYRDVDMIEKPKPAPKATPAVAPATGTGVAAKPPAAETAEPATRKVRIIRTADMETFLKENKADVLALLVVETDEQHGQERLVALWLWGRDPLTKGLFTPSACVQANKIDEGWPEATESEMVSLWTSLIDLERRLVAAKTVNVNLPHKTTP